LLAFSVLGWMAFLACFLEKRLKMEDIAMRKRQGGAIVSTVEKSRSLISRPQGDADIPTPPIATRLPLTEGKETGQSKSLCPREKVLAFQPVMA
jgi:hypothetical protein